MNETTSLVWLLASIGATQLVAVISPGPSFLITAQTAVAKSRWEGVQIAIGLGAGTVIWAAAALFGLKAVFLAFPALFIGMKLLGALFLIYIAYMIFYHAAAPLELNQQVDPKSGGSFLKGFLTQIGNPKVMVFFGSIFVALVPSDAPLWLALTLVALVSFNEVWWYCLVAMFFGYGPIRRYYLQAKVWIDRITGLFLGAVGLRLLGKAFDPV